ncbi:MAG: hypothetical protein NC041_02365 [Bacteroides sp.]|nr:hypothetical protein [Prevotella sp.]MCM1407553.1 hypothetical protein [Treponema brennaborense]MCM1469297.1 hypothetical protein [Bacteroides sp.]
MKRLVTLFALIAVIGTANLFAFGIGVQAGWNKNIPGQVAVTFKPNSIPFVFAVNGYFGDNWAVGGTADYWFLNRSITGGRTCWFLGAGVGAIIGDNGDDPFFNVAARLPIGLNWFFQKGIIELYVQGVPQLGLECLPSFGLHGFDIDIAGGIRFWIK